MSTPFPPQSGPFPAQSGPQGPFTGPNPQQNSGFPPAQFPGQAAPGAGSGQAYPAAQQQPQGSPYQHAMAPHPGQRPSGSFSNPAQSGISQQVFAAASRATPFWNLIRVELRKLVGTRSDRILLTVGPLVLIGLNLLFYLPTSSNFYSAQNQISPLVWATRIMAVIIHATLIKLVAGEWQHRSAQPTLLVQPSRIKYFLAQAMVALGLWLFCATIQAILSLLLSPVAATNSGAGYLLSDRIGWVLGVAFLGSLLNIAVALIVAMLLPNAAGALAVYFVAVPSLLILGGLAPKVFIWIDPTAAVQVLATTSAVSGPAPALVSLLLWIGLLVFSGFRVLKRDVL